MFADLARLSGKAMRLEESIGSRVAKILDDASPGVKQRLGGLSHPSGKAALELPNLKNLLIEIAAKPQADKPAAVAAAEDNLGSMLQVMDIQMKISMVKLKIRQLEDELDALLEQAREIGAGAHPRPAEALRALERTALRASQQQSRAAESGRPLGGRSLTEEAKLQQQAQQLQGVMENISNIMKRQHEMQQSTIRNLR